jgi:hypothetical protein
VPHYGTCACHRAPWSALAITPRGSALFIAPHGLRLPSRPPWSACHRAPRGPLAVAPRDPVIRLPSCPVVGACHHTPWVGAFHRAPCGPLAVAPRDPLAIAPRGRRLPSRPVCLRLPLRPPWSACHRASWSALAITPRVCACHCAPRGPLAIVPRGLRLPSRPVGLRLPLRPPWSACHRALRSSKFLSRTEEHRAELRYASISNRELVIV